MFTKENCVQKYNECKLNKNGELPEYREFLRYSGIPAGQLTRLFGSSAYTKLQKEAGDAPNQFGQERTSFERIMEQYGRLVTELGFLPPYSEWDHRGLRPTRTGLNKKPHSMNWSELPVRFVEWAKTNKIQGFDNAIQIIEKSRPTHAQETEKVEPGFLGLIRDVRAWTPARRRNNEAEYKIELRKHLESLNHTLNEEFGESKYDLLVRGQYAIEIKKDPNLSEYDRLFGQLARHLQHRFKAIVLILEATNNDRYDNFTALVDKYLNIDKNSVEIVKK
jgi:hypothetical protein